MKRFIIIMGGILMAGSMLTASGCEWNYRGDGGRHGDYYPGYYRYDNRYERNDHRGDPDSYRYDDAR
jgi:hypothetical protein